ncbi:SRPBCC family protein [Nonomuraea cypriaca]|nr:SRPBCC family protein [Nonomuraea cypriaca]
MLGTLHKTEDGRFALRFERRLSHPQAKVWRAITETDQLRVWFVQILDYDRTQFGLTPGAKLVFYSKAEHGGTLTGHGEITRVDPPHLLEYTWDSEILRWELEPDGDAACRLVFTDIFDDREAAAPLGAGWHAGMDALEELLNGRRTGPSAGQDLQATYERAFDAA